MERDPGITIIGNFNAQKAKIMETIASEPTSGVKVEIIAESGQDFDTKNNPRELILPAWIIPLGMTRVRVQALNGQGVVELNPFFSLVDKLFKLTQIKTRS